MVARRFSGEGPTHNAYLMRRLERDLGETVPQSEALVAEYSGIPAPAPVRWGVIGRAQWADANISSMSRLLGPLADKVSDRLDALPLPARLAQTAAVSVEVGVLLGYISRRVLGQYDLLVPESSSDESERPRRFSRQNLPADDAALYFVGPNIVETERKFGFVPREFALWVALHEVTHRFQFDGVPWLRDRFLSLVRGYMESVDLDVRGLVSRLGTAASKLLTGSVPPDERNPVYLLATEEQRRRLDDIQALMAVVEGHGNFVMDTVGAQRIPTFERMRRIFEVRRAQTTRLQRAIHHVIGLEMKMRQYELGQRFCNEVVAAGGARALAKLWVAPEHLPSLDELREPQRWLIRVA
jgi:coenzyme F420 biosynthesis associated uncharacterized protein